MRTLRNGFWSVFREVLVVFLLISLPFLMYLGFFLKKTYLFKGKLSDNVCIRQVPFANQYNFHHCASDGVIVLDVFSWNYVGGFYYGAYTDESNNMAFYLFSVKNFNVLKFSSLQDLDNQLSKLKLPELDMSLEMNPSYLKAGGYR